MGFSRVSELAAIIQSNSLSIDAYHASRGLPPRSLDAKAPIFLVYPSEVESCRQTVLAATYEMQALMQTPLEICSNIARYGNAGLHVIARRDIASSIPLDGTMTFGQIAEKSGSSEQTARRLLRDAISLFIFKEVQPGVVAHTSASRALVEVPYLSAWINFVLDDIWAGMTGVADALTERPDSAEPSHAGWNIVKRENDSFFKVIGKDLERAERFKNAMMLFMTRPTMRPGFALQGFDWSAYSSATVVDIGGSHGLVAIELAKAYPDMRIIVQDLPEVVNGAAASIPKSLSEQITFMAHDFFKQQPVIDAKIYYLRWILHDWADKHAIAILRNLIPALRPGDWVLINEMCVPPAGTISVWQERWLRMFDTAMMGFQNGHERDAEEWDKLVTEADIRFKLRRIVRAEGSDLSMMQVQWDG